MIIILYLTYYEDFVLHSNIHILIRKACLFVFFVCFKTVSKSSFERILMMYIILFCKSSETKTEQQAKSECSAIN